MSEAECRAGTFAVMARLRHAETCGQALFDSIQFHDRVQRQSKHGILRAIALIENEGGFAERGVVVKAAVADLLRIRPAEAARLTRLASRVFLTVSLSGELLPPTLPCTAVAMGEDAIDQAHGLVTDAALRTAAAGRLSPGVWAGALVRRAPYPRMVPVVAARISTI